MLRIHLALPLVVVTNLFSGSSTVSAAIVFANSVIVLTRYRAAFNGDSDVMTTVFSASLLAANVTTLFRDVDPGWTVVR